MIHHDSIKGRKVLVAMSGGVDSSVAAALLQQRGYQVVGCFMRLGSPDEPDTHTSSGRELFETRPDQPRTLSLKMHHQGCCSLNDAADARLVAAKLNIPLYVLNFRNDFDKVIDYFVSEYNAGRTPNPCVRCNDWLKFGKLFTYAQSIEADFIATGHYARIVVDAVGQSRLCRGLDTDKDQSYVLFGTRRERLGSMLLPIGDMRKSEVRALAKQFDLPVFDKPDSQEICFVPDNDYAGLIERRTPQLVSEGEIVDTGGKVIGKHRGQQHFTIGQRRGVGVAMGQPMYVVDKDAQSNRVTLGPRDELLATGLRAGQTHWLVDAPAVGESMRCEVKIRYNSKPVTATVQALDTDTWQVIFNQPQPAVTPGQAVVAYDGDVVLGGGWIDAAIK